VISKANRFIINKELNQSNNVSKCPKSCEKPNNKRRYVIEDSLTAVENEDEICDIITPDDTENNHRKESNKVTTY